MKQNLVINLTDKYRVRSIPNNLQLEEYKEGGKRQNNPKIISKGGWKPIDVYYQSLDKIVKHVVTLESQENSRDLNDFLMKYEELSKELWGNAKEELKEVLKNESK